MLPRVDPGHEIPSQTAAVALIIRVTMNDADDGELSTGGLREPQQVVDEG